MRIRWTPAAAADLQGMSGYLQEHNSHDRQPTMRRLYETIRLLKKEPYHGLPGTEEGARDILFPPLPFIPDWSATAHP
jgi:plasmid stabilization system protein ParE